MLHTVTIGITAYNAEDTILAALQSAANQSYDAVCQIIVVDDHSTDTTMSVLNGCEFVDRIEVYQNPENSGVAYSRNEIIKHATGDFIAFFDDDDVSLPERVSLQLQRIRDYEASFAKGAPVLCHTARLQIYPDGHERIESTMGIRQGQPAPSGMAVVRRTLMGDPLEDAYGSCATCSQMGRTSMYRELGGFDVSFRRCEDSDLAIRLAASGGHFVGLDEPLVVQHMTGTSDKSLRLLCDYSLKLLDKHRDLFRNDALYHFSRRWLEMKYDWLGGKWPGFVGMMLQLAVSHPLLTSHRVKMAMPNLAGNNAFRRFAGGMKK